MNEQNPTSGHPVVQAIRNLINKLRQNPEVYPIKYYKKGGRLRKNYRSHLIK